MADEYNRLAMYSVPMDDQVNMLRPQLPAGHPSNMLMGLRDMIPQVQADDSSTMSGITSRLGRTATALPRGALETMANWLQGTHDSSAVRIGEDTIAPLGLFGMGTGLANAMTRAPKGAVGHIPADAPLQRAGDGGGVTRFSHVLEQPKHRLVRENDNAPSPIVGSMHRQDIGGAEHLYVIGPDSGSLATRVDGSIHRPSDFGVKLPGAGRPANDLLADNARSSVPGTVVNAMGEQPSRGWRDWFTKRQQPEQPVRAYHGSASPRSDGTFDASKMGSEQQGFFFTTRPDLASQYSKGGIAPVAVMRGAFDESFRRGYMESLPNGGRRVINRAEHDKLVREIEESWLPDGANVTPVNIDPSKIKSIDADGYRWESDSGRLIDDASEAAKKEGYHGIKLRGMADEKLPPGETSDVFAVWGRGNVKSATTGDVLFSNPLASAPGLSASASQQQPDSAVLDILSRYGLY